MLDRFHQADIAFLDQVEQITRRAGKFIRDFDDQPQIRGD